MSSDVTQLLQASRDGGEDALERLLPLVYEELRGLADRHLRSESKGHTLQPTALVHEAYVRLVGQRNRNWANRQQFFCIASKLMRRVLLHHAEKRGAQKRGGDRQRATMLDLAEEFEHQAVDLLALDEALRRLEQLDENKHRIVELRFFGGLTLEEIAHVLEVSDRTVRRNWSFAKAWLRKEMGVASS